MKALVTETGQFGPFSSIETLADRYRCDGVDYQFSVIGAATIEDYVAPPPPAEEQAQAAQAFQAAVVTATQARLDAFAHTRNYDGILSACTYATSSVPRFAADGQTAVDLRDATWATLYTLMGEVQAGTRPMPGTADEVLALLPELTWPV